VLLRAFGPPGAAVTVLPDPAILFARAERLSLTARIASRAARSADPRGDRPGLAEELGAEGAAPFRAARRAAAARDTQLEALAAAVAGVAAEVGIPVALLKYAALRASGALSAAGRLASDVDLLVRRGDAPPLHAALLARGWRASGLPAWEHHLPALVHPGLGELEIHDRLPGLSPPGGRGSTGGAVGAAGYDDLAGAGALEPCSWPHRSTDASRAGGASPATLRVPSRPVLLAHALVHGLVQHGWAPRSYPPWRGVSDWIDLGLGQADGDTLLAAASAWIGGSLAAEEERAARRLCTLLVAGRPEALTDWADRADPADRPGGAEGVGPSDRDGALAAALGRHLLAGPLDATYRRSLRLDRLVPTPAAGRSGEVSDGLGTSATGALAATVRRALVPPRAELAALYGPWRSRWGLLWRRLVRPADLALRVITAAAGRLRGRWRGPVRL